MLKKIVAVFLISVTFVSCSTNYYNYNFTYTHTTFLDVADFASKPAMGVGAGVAILGAGLMRFSESDGQIILITGISIFSAGLILMIINTIAENL